MEEQLREDKQDLKMREQKKRAKDAKRIRGIVHEHDKNRGSHVQDKMELMWEGWHWDDNIRGWA